eukprot:gene3371-6032_t
MANQDFSFWRKAHFYSKFFFGFLLPLMLVRRIFGKKRGFPSFLLSLCGHAALPCIGVSYKLEGRTDLLEQGHDTFVYVLNHQSQLDSMIMSCNIPDNLVVVAKRSLLLMPGINFVLWLSDAILLDRSNREASIKSMAVAAEKDKCGCFPGRNSKPEWWLTSIQKGRLSFSAASADPVDGIYNSSVYLFGSGLISVRILDPIEHIDGESVDELCVRTRSTMLKALADMRPANKRTDFTNNTAS